MTDYVHRSLTHAIADKMSPLRRYLDVRFPSVRALQKDYRSRVGDMRVAPLVGGGGANGGTLGAAFDFAIRFQVSPDYIPEIALYAFGGRPDYAAAIEEVIRRGGQCAAGATDLTELDRACWALALCTEVYRAGLYPGSPLALLIEQDSFTPDVLLSLIPDDGLRQMAELRTLAQDELLPHLRTPLYLGPTFDASQLCPADADLISDGLLLDLKTAVKGNSLSREDLYQLLAYALFDHSNAYGLDRIGIYSARFGALVTWELIPTLELLAGGTVDLAAEREKIWSLLGGPML